METETLKYISAIAETKKRYPTTSWIRITTITMTAKYPDMVDVPRFRELFKASGSYGWTLVEKDNKFYNCVTIVTRDQYTTKNVKIFPNGSIQVTGCCDLTDCPRVAKKVAMVLNQILGKSHEIDEETIQTRLINTNFSFNYVLNLYTIYECLKKDKTYQVSHDPDRCAELRVKFTPLVGEKHVTLKLFSSGKAMALTGGSIKVIAAAYKHINQKIEDMKAKVEPTDKPQQYPVFMGYTFETWLKMIEKKGL